MVLHLSWIVTERVLSWNFRMRIWPTRRIGIFYTRQTAPSRKVGLVRRPAELRNQLELVDLGRAFEQWPTRDHLGQDTSDPPHVDRRAVLLLSRQ